MEPNDIDHLAFLRSKMQTMCQFGHFRMAMGQLILLTYIMLLGMWYLLSSVVLRMARAHCHFGTFFILNKRRDNAQ